MTYKSDAFMVPSSNRPGNQTLNLEIGVRASVESPKPRKFDRTSRSRDMGRLKLRERNPNAFLVYMGLWHSGCATDC